LVIDGLESLILAREENPSAKVAWKKGPELYTLMPCCMVLIMGKGEVKDQHCILSEQTLTTRMATVNTEYRSTYMHVP
jgi:hypothetical protein